MLKLLRRLLLVGLVSAAGYAIWKKVSAGSAAGPQSLGWQAQPPPFPPAPVLAPAVPTPPAVAVAPGEPRVAEIPVAGHPDGDPPDRWVVPDEGACPVSHPVKARLASGIFHVPGGQSYDRTRADRCYADPAAAEADGLRRAKR